MTTRIKSILKYAFALSLLGFILHHTGTQKILGYLGQISPLQWVLALSCASAAQLMSALRMRYFFKASGFALGKHFAVILYYVGAFYNFLLPGGIGGDAYKVILARRRMAVTAKDGIRIMVADRASGMCIVMLMMFAALGHLDFSHTIPYSGFLLLAAAGGTLIAYVLFSRWLLGQSARVMLCSLWYSLIAQSLWVGTLYAIWVSIGNGQHLLEYIALYSAASIVGVIPISVGGLGIKELTYYYGATFILTFAGISVDPDLGVALSLCMFAMIFLTSLPGLVWLEKAEHSKIF